ncbi:hypothetical protein TNCV_4115391 [Trichonephila clavipes]|nr:hypothetical protein TNCV_4115391 [Trichonephila clavipes]
MDDSARPDRALLVDEFPESKDIHWMDWSVRSLDLTPIDHVSYALGNDFNSQTLQRTIQGLKIEWLREWN